MYILIADRARTSPAEVLFRWPESMYEDYLLVIRAESEGHRLKAEEDRLTSKLKGMKR